ncbi:PIR Superfamily Protein [Plasmodium ovale wallikeri]|uniref:PIR Superfamily Protein n=1 Tax=Plasmodium ovale wallikeri TaxID=864142 RepID=A0A1A9AHE7_PLAOA|nr:PIR Superfamily Protein [Plasmodium ovale wallikeri]SBT55521.1 PIR Superfamily Protein [Plasmodium ovale wallikeri]
MDSDISLNDLPSKKYYDELKDILSYDDLIFSVINEGGESFVSKWTSDLDKNLRGYLEKYESDITITNGTKRCRDLIDILDNIIKQIKNSDYYVSHKFTEQTIDTFIKSVVVTYCDTSSRNTTEEKEVTEYKKLIDDFMEDVEYIKDNISKINSSPNCPKILSYIEMQNTIVKAILNQKKQEYSRVLTLHDESIIQNYDNIVKNIVCASSESKAYVGESSGQSQHSGGNASTVAAISLPGIPLIFFFLYKFTHLGTVFNNRIGKKIKFWNNAYEEPNEILDNNTEYINTNTNNEEYNILYDSTSMS